MPNVPDLLLTALLEVHHQELLLQAVLLQVDHPLLPLALLLVQELYSVPVVSQIAQLVNLTPVLTVLHNAVPEFLQAKLVVLLAVDVMLVLAVVNLQHHQAAHHLQVDHLLLQAVLLHQADQQLHQVLIVI